MVKLEKVAILVEKMLLVGLHLSLCDQSFQLKFKQKIEDLLLFGIKSVLGSDLFYHVRALSH